MPEAKLEILVREDAARGDGFTIRELTSGLVYAAYRPMRVAEGSYEVAGDVSPVEGKRYYVLKGKGSGDYLSLTDREYFLWELMDGSRTIKDIASAYFFHFGSLDLTAIKALLARLRAAGLVEFVPALRLRVAAAGTGRGLVRAAKDRLNKVDFRLEDADGWVTGLYEKGGYFLVGRYSMLLYAALSAVGMAAFGRFERIGKFPYDLFFEHPFLMVAVVVLSMVPIAAVHELFHALACKRFGRKVHAFGFTLWDGFYPSIYTDVSDMYLSPRKERIYVSLAGPISTTAIAAVFFIPVAISPEASWAETFYEIGRLNLLVGFLSLYPFQFLKMDGYYLLVDLLGLPGIRERAFSLVRGLPDYIKAKKRLTCADTFVLAYFILSLLSITGFAAYFFML